MSTLKQTDFISQARHMLNEYNKKTANAVQSIPIHSLFVVSTKTETSLGTVHWYLAFRVMNCRLDLGKETMSCYLEITDDSQQSSDLQLLSIRYSFLPYMTHSWSSLTSLDLIDRVFSLRIVYTLSSSSENDFLLPFLPSNENSLCIRIAFSNQDEFSICKKYLDSHPYTTLSVQTAASVKASLSNRTELSLSQTAHGCKSSVVALPTMRSSVIGQPIEQGTLKDAVPEKTVVPATQESEVLSPVTPERKKSSADVLGSLHSTPERPEKKSEEMNQDVKEENLDKENGVEEKHTVNQTEVNMAKQSKEIEKPVETLPIKKITSKKTTNGRNKGSKEDVSSQLAALTRRRPSGFLSQLAEAMEDRTVKENPKLNSMNQALPTNSTKKPLKKKEGRKQIPSKDNSATQLHQTPLPSVSNPQSPSAPPKPTPSTSKSTSTSPNQVPPSSKSIPSSPKQIPTASKPVLPSPKPLKLRHPDPEDFSDDEETLPIKRKWNLSEKQPKRTATAQTAGRKKAKLVEPATIEEKQLEMEESSDWESDPQNEVNALMDKFKTILATPKIKATSTESSPSSNGSESDDDLDDPSILAVQQAFTSW